jgi:hypothetical protein
MAMFSAISSSANAAYNYLTSFIPTPLSQTVSTVSDVAQDVLSFIAFPRSILLEPAVYRPTKSLSFYRNFKKTVETPYEKGILLKQLRLKPKISKACLISDYLTLLSSTKITHKIYEKLKNKWGYQQFYRTSETGSKSLAYAFIMYVLLEDSSNPICPLHDRLASYLATCQSTKRFPAFQDNIAATLEALIQGQSVVDSITSYGSNTFLETLSGIIIAGFYEKMGIEQDLNLINFIEQISDPSLKASVKATLATLGDLSPAPLVPLLGPKQSFFGYNPLTKFSFLLENLPTVLSKVKKQLKAHVDVPVIGEWIEALDPIKILCAFEVDPIGIAKKESLKPRMIEVFKQELIKLFTPNASLFLEGFSFSKRASHVSHFECIADEIISLDGAYLMKLTQIPVAKLVQIAETLEAYEEALSQHQLRFAHYLSDLFNVSFVIHSWQISQQDRKRLKIQHIGKWDDPTCHIVLFPENNQLRVDLLKQHGQYSARSNLIDLTNSLAFTKFKRHSSETLATIAKPTSSYSEADKHLAKHFIYYRIHVFSCLQKLLHQKLPLLKDPLNFDSAGNKEDDSALFNPFGPESGELPPTFSSEAESSLFRIEKHLSGLNREIAELTYLTDCIFSQSKHEDIVSEIQLLLKAAKKTTFAFYLRKIPMFIEAFATITVSLKGHIDRLSKQLNDQKEAFIKVNPAKMEAFLTTLSPKRTTLITSAEIIELVPQLKIEFAPPIIFENFRKFHKMVSVYQDALAINQALLEGEIRDLKEKISKESGRYCAFYPDKSALFLAIFTAADPLPISISEIDKLIPADKLQHAEIKSIVSMLVSLSNKLKRLDYKSTTLSGTNIEAIRAYQSFIKAKRAEFESINPTKLTIFDKIFNEADLQQIKIFEISILKTVPKPEQEEVKVFKDLRSLLTLVQKHRGFVKEHQKLKEKKALLEIKNPGGLVDVSFYDSEEDEYPEVGSLGSQEGETSSLGGASYSSELRSIGSVEEWVNSLLI